MTKTYDMKQPAILANLGRSKSGWEILQGTDCHTQQQMEEYVEYFFGGASCGYPLKVVDLAIEDMSLLKAR